MYNDYNNSYLNFRLKAGSCFENRLENGTANIHSTVKQIAIEIPITIKPSVNGSWSSVSCISGAYAFMIIYKIKYMGHIIWLIQYKLYSISYTV